VPGDTVILIAYGVYDEAEVAGHTPSVVFVDDRNRMVRLALQAQG
jgi:aspartate 1-decarboxylase